MASKLEDNIPIKLRRLKMEAGHNKFKTRWIRAKEINVIKTLSCRLLLETVYEKAMIMMKTILLSVNIRLPRQDEEILMQFLTFISQLSVHSYELAAHTDRSFLIISLISLTFKFMKAFIETEGS
jgi:hypothetical protein